MQVQQGYNGAAGIHITYYTDPLCCWSWAMEPAWQQLLALPGMKLTWRYCMGGMIPDWNSYNDVQQHVSRPIQMGPVWLEAKHASGQPVNERIWYADPPSSSYPACLAVKSAALQSPEAEHQYLQSLRRAVMAEGRNIARKEVLVAVATELSAAMPEVLDAARFEEDLSAGAGLEAFRADLQEVSYRDIRRFPTLVFQHESGEGLVATGFRSLPAMQAILEQFTTSQSAPETPPSAVQTPQSPYRPPVPHTRLSPGGISSHRRD